MASRTIGNYVNGNSLIHKIDPRIKLLVNIALIAIVFLTRELLVLTIIFVPILGAFFASGLKKYSLVRYIRTVLLISIFLFIVNIIIIPETDSNISYGNWWVFSLTNQSLKQTAVIAYRIFIIIMTTSLLTATTKPIALTQAIEDLLSPLKYIKFPVHIVAMIISIALRFIPTLLLEAQRIIKAQSSRGVDFVNGNIKSKFKSTITLIIPLFVSAFSKAEDLGNAMEARGYDPYQKRTRYRNYKLTYIDLLVALLTIGLVIFTALSLYDSILDIPRWMAW